MIERESTIISPRESILLEHETEENDKNRAHEVELKRLEFEVERLNVKWSNIVRLPIEIVRLPLYVVAGIALIVAYIRKYKPSQEFWDLLNKR